MRVVLAPILLLSLNGVTSLQETPRQLRKDYGYDTSVSSKSSKGSSSKSGKSSSKSAKGSSDSSNSYYGSEDGYDGSGKSGKGGSKSGKSSGKSSKSSRSSAYGHYEGETNAAKYHGSYQIDDDDVFDLGHGDDVLTSNSFEIDEGKVDDGFDDAVQDDAEFYDDAPVGVDGDDNVANEDAQTSESAGSNDGGTTIDIAADDSLEQHSWLTNLISGKEPNDDDAADSAIEGSMSIPDASAVIESMSLSLDDESLDQNAWLTDLISGKEPTDDDDDDMFDDSLEGSMSMIGSFGKVELESMSIGLENEILDQNSWLTDLVSGKEPEADDDDDSMSIGSKEDADNSVGFESGSTLVFVDDEIVELALESSMSTSADDLEFSMAFDEFHEAVLDSSLSIVFDVEFDLEQADVDFGSMSIPGVIEVGEKDTTANHNLDNGKTNETNDDTTIDANDTDDNPSLNDGDDTTDDRAVDDDVESTEFNSNYLSQDERTQIILEKCNTTPLGRAISLIEAIGNHIDPQDIVSQSADSPQYMAFLWIVYFDDAILCAPPSQINNAAEFDGVTRLLLNMSGKSSRTLATDNSIMNIHDTLDRIMQRYALAMLYFSFQGYGWDNCSSDRNLVGSSANSECVGSNGEELVRFLDAVHECEWFGVTCLSNSTESFGVDSYYPVTHLELPSNNLHGYISTDISLLYTLEVLDLRNNEITGTIPFSAFAQMNSLDTLLLSGNDELYGDASRYCQSSTLGEMLLFETDCTPLVEQLRPAPVKCSCCTSCK